MPVISEFYGISIRIYYKEHNPPHIHVSYGEYASEIRIDNLEVLEGNLPKRALKLVKEWITIHQKELIEMWNTESFKNIEPLI